MLHHVRSFGAAFALKLWHTGSAVVTHGLQSTQTSVAVTRGLSCSVVCGILVPRPEIEPTSPALQGVFLATGPPGKSLISCSNSWAANHSASPSCTFFCKIGTVILIRKAKTVIPTWPLSQGFKRIEGAREMDGHT